MTLAHWITETGEPRAEIARLLDISTGHLTDLAAGRFWPTRKTWQRIWLVTGGKVTPNDHLWDGER